MQDQKRSTDGRYGLWEGEVVRKKAPGWKISLYSDRCVNGHCESTSKNIGRSDGLKHNSLDGSWGSWSRSSHFEVYSLYKGHIM